MSIIGKGNWWLPGWLDRILPKVQIEPGEDELFDEGNEKDQRSQPTPVG
jgi:RND superfamily putative drug exporter